MNKPLTAFHGPDTHGKVWTVDDLKGKTTLIVIWATWCHPCRVELPTVQKMFDDLKSRQDVQLLTVSTDEDTAVIAPFAQSHRYTFPILSITSAAIDLMAGIEGIPRTWIVDSTGSLRFEAIGYNPALWPDEIVHQLTSVE